MMLLLIILINFYFNKIRYIITNAVKESSPEVGSSNIKQSGSLTNSTPIDALFLSPPEIPFNNSFPIFY